MDSWVTLLELDHISKSFARSPALLNINLGVAEGEILCLLGPSGCGKTTLLRVIAGLETPDEGRVFLAGQDISGIPPHQRDFGLMFQDFALFPHRNAGENVGFGLRMKREADVQTRIRMMLELVGLDGFEERDVSSLSGGERQRVALARSLAPNPRLLMLDEPLGALDRALRERLMLEIRQILKTVGLTAIYVTHDQAEAFAVADRIVVMNRGQIEQYATPEQLYRQPATPFVAEFLGFSNLLEATCLADGRIKTALGTWAIKSKRPCTGKKVVALVRPEAASLQPVAGSIAIKGVVANVLFRGRFYQVAISTAGYQFRFEMPLPEIFPVGRQITFWLDPAAILLLPPDRDMAVSPQNNDL